MNKNRSDIFFVAILLLSFGCVFTMDKKNQGQSNWSFIVSMGCKECGVNNPYVPQLKIIESASDEQLVRGSYLRDGVKSHNYCIHSTLGPFRALSTSSVSVDKDINDGGAFIEDKILYRGPLGTNYKADTSLLDTYPFFSAQKCLFTGSSLLAGNIRFNKNVAYELRNFFSIATRNGFDVFDVLTKRWPDNFIVDACAVTSMHRRYKKRTNKNLPGVIKSVS